MLLLTAPPVTLRLILMRFTYETPQFCGNQLLLFKVLASDGWGCGEGGGVGSAPVAIAGAERDGRAESVGGSSSSGGGERGKGGKNVNLGGCR